MTSFERAQKLWKRLDDAYRFQIGASGTETTDGVKWIAAEIEAVKKETFEEAAKIAEEHSKGRQCPKAYEGHDDRWCDKCEAYQDQAEFIMQEIRRRAAEGEK